MVRYVFSQYLIHGIFGILDIRGLFQDGKFRESLLECRPEALKADVGAVVNLSEVVLTATVAIPGRLRSWGLNQFTF
jgi:hypothetical protein